MSIETPNLRFVFNTVLEYKTYFINAMCSDVFFRVIEDKSSLISYNILRIRSAKFNIGTGC